MDNGRWYINLVNVFRADCKNSRIDQLKKKMKASEKQNFAL